MLKCLFFSKLKKRELRDIFQSTESTSGKICGHVVVSSNDIGDRRKRQNIAG